MPCVFAAKVNFSLSPQPNVVYGDERWRALMNNLFFPWYTAHTAHPANKLHKTFAYIKLSLHNRHVRHISHSSRTICNIALNLFFWVEKSFSFFSTGDGIFCFIWNLFFVTKFEVKGKTVINGLFKIWKFSKNLEKFKFWPFFSGRSGNLWFSVWKRNFLLEFF